MNKVVCWIERLASATAWAAVALIMMAFWVLFMVLAWLFIKWVIMG